MSGDKERDLSAGVQTRSQEIAEPGFIESEWERFCNDNRRMYLSAALGFDNNRLCKNRLFRLLNRRGLMQRLLCSREAPLTLTNMIRCEAHREALIAVLESAVPKKKK